MASAILDSSAILAVLNGEPGAEAVLLVLDGAAVSAVNYAEVASKLVDKGATRSDARKVILSLGVQVVDFGIDLADRTGELRPTARHRGLSLGDRACLALAEHKNAPVFTADRTWRDVLQTVEINVVR